MPTVAVVVLNWNGWRDTVACLSSVFAAEYEHVQVVVCDNGSTDDSLDEIERWALTARRRHAEGVLGHPLRWMRTDRAVLDGGAISTAAFGKADLILVSNGANLGFAAGNNVGIRAALTYSDASFVWLLNNDTVVERQALKELIARMESVKGCGICGSTLVLHHAPDTLQAVAGVYNRWLARTDQLAFGAKASTSFDDDEMTRQADFVVGASMLLSITLLKEVGLLSEDYFLYFEEIDLITRARGRFSFACATRSRVTHKWGASINPDRERRNSELADYYFSRARLIFTCRYYPYALPTVVIAVIGSAIARFLRWDLICARAVLTGLFDGLYRRRGMRTFKLSS